MANTHAHPTTSFGTSAGAGALLHNLGALITTRRNQMNERARIRRELESFTDRQLSDLGLSRFDIDDVSTGRYAR